MPSDLDRAINEVIDEIEGISETTKIRREKYSVIDNWAIVLTYLSSKRLLKHSRCLTWLTIGLIVLGAGMIGLAIWQLLVLSQV